MTSPNVLETVVVLLVIWFPEVYLKVKSLFQAAQPVVHHTASTFELIKYGHDEGGK